MEPHEELIRWATGSGVVLNGIKPKRIPGRGIGIVATRPLKVRLVWHLGLYGPRIQSRP